MPLFMVMIDVDRIPELLSVSRLTGYNRFNWASFHDRDHFGDPSLSLRDRVESDARKNTVTLPDGPIFLLTHLRYLGYAFNPVSFFYCYDRNGRLGAVLAEVNNTFGETRNYWLTEENMVGGEGMHRYRTDKRLHVSPFMPMEMEYTFGFSGPAESLTVYMSTREGRQTKFDATLELELREWTTKNIRSALRRHPWMTAKVILAIHWHALLLLLKKVPVYPNPTGRSWKVW